jgi:hypothetical protein
MSAYKNNRVEARRRVKYTEQPFPQPETKVDAHVYQQSQSPLFKIPRDLRNIIFDLALDSGHESIEIDTLFYSDEHDMSKFGPGASVPPSTALVCTLGREFQGGRPHDRAFKAFTSDGLRELMLMIG